MKRLLAVLPWPVTGLTYRVDDRRAQWRGGRVYNTENGKRYDGYAGLVDANHLRLRGYIGVSWVGRTTTWRRVPDPRAPN